MDGTHEVYVIGWEHPSRVSAGLTKIQATTRPDYLWLEIWIGMSKAAQKEKQERAVEKPKVDNARKLRGKTKSTKKPWKTCKKETRNSFGRGYALQDGNKKAFLKATRNCSKWSHSPTQENQVCLCCGKSRIHKETCGIYSFREITRITVQGKDSIPSTTKVWCTNFFSCFRRCKFRMRKLQWVKNGRSSRKNQPGRWRK